MEGDRIGRLAQLLAFHKEDPDDSFVRFALAAEYAKLGREEDARRAFEALREHDPDYVGTYYHLGKLYERTGMEVRAIETYRAGIDAAMRMSDFHARAELQSALMEAEGMGFE